MIILSISPSHTYLVLLSFGDISLYNGARMHFASGAMCQHLLNIAQLASLSCTSRCTLSYDKWCSIHQRKKFFYETAPTKVCGLSQVTGSWILERDFAVVMNCSFKMFRVAYATYIRIMSTEPVTACIYILLYCDFYYPIVSGVKTWKQLNSSLHWWFRLISCSQWGRKMQIYIQ